ncbi:MAG: MFS transporter [Chitinophagaceae bacterium]|nr:MAG: MFS transporter [Chitinophagaceae bacterium]
MSDQLADVNAASGKGHPKGLWVLFGTEMWERFAYYGMRAILVLFMTKALMFDKVFASNLYGSYTSLVYLTPLIGGFVADRFWGNQRSIIVGGIVMALGQFVLFMCASTYVSAPDLSAILFFSGLGLMIAGNGFFKPNISSLVGQLYPKGDRRIDSAYTIFYMGINVGGAFGPFICGLVGDTGNPADFKWAFLAAGIGMVLGVIVQLIFHKKYVLDPAGKTLGMTPAGTPKAWLNPVLMVLGLAAFSGLAIGLLYIDAKVVPYLTYLLIAATLFIAFIIFSDKTLNFIEKQRITVIFIVAFFVIFFWSAFEQAGASLTFFAEEQTQRDLGFFTVPASWFQSLNSVFVVVFAPVFAWLWIKLGKREPSSPTKMAIGLFLLALGYLWISVGVKDVGVGIKVSMIWLIGMYALHTWGELCLSPIGLSLVNKLAPFKYASLLMAVWFLANAAANKLAGVLSALYPDGRTTSFLGYEMSNNYDFFMLFVAMAGVASLILFLLTKKLQQMMHVGKE